MKINKESLLMVNDKFVRCTFCPWPSYKWDHWPIEWTCPPLHAYIYFWVEPSQPFVHSFSLHILLSPTKSSLESMLSAWTEPAHERAPRAFTQTLDLSGCKNSLCFVEQRETFPKEWRAQILCSKRYMMSAKYTIANPLKFLWKTSDPNRPLYYSSQQTINGVKSSF